MKPKHIKNILLSEIHQIALEPEKYCINPKADFTRKRKLPLEQLIHCIVSMGGGTLSNELLDFFHCSSNAASSSAFVQQRCKIKAEAFESIFKGFSKRLLSSSDRNMKFLAVDGSDIQIPVNPEDYGSYFPGANGQKPYNLLHLNALYDLEKHIYSDVLIQKRRDANEHRAFVDMIDCSEIAYALVIADRGYESYNNMAHLQEKGWKFLIRIKDGNTGIKSSLDLPETDDFDVSVRLLITRKNTKEIKELCKDKNRYRYIPTTTPFDYLPASKYKEPAQFYGLKFRIVRFKLSEDCYETVLTNLEPELYPPEKLKELYALRWGIETSFRHLKYTVGMLKFHSKKVMCVLQEIYAHLIMYNFAEMITSHVVIEKKQRKHQYKANFSVAVHMCRMFYQGNTSPPTLEAVIARHLLPVRPDRHRERKLTQKVFQGFLYRIA